MISTKLWHICWYLTCKFPIVYSECILKFQLWNYVISLCRVKSICWRFGIAGSRFFLLAHKCIATRMVCYIFVYFTCWMLIWFWLWTITFISILYIVWNSLWTAIEEFPCTGKCITFSTCSDLNDDSIPLNIFGWVVFVMKPCLLDACISSLII